MKNPAAESKPVVSPRLKTPAHLDLILCLQAANGGLQREFANP